MALPGIPFTILIGVAIGVIVYQIIKSKRSGIHQPVSYGQRAIPGPTRPSIKIK